MTARALLKHASGVCQHVPRRALHTSRTRYAVSPLTMPAMSPTMTEGGIASWKKAEGEAFSTGDVLLEIETDKATMDVEAQDDGVMGKIVLPDGSKGVPVGKIIALLAEEGDDISDLKVPSEGEASAPAPPAKEVSSPPPPPPSASSSSSTAPKSSSPATPASKSHGEKPTHSRPLFPSVMRLLQENGVTDANGIKGTGVRGMLTKGDVLAHLGKASSPWGTSKDPRTTASSNGVAAPPAKPEVKILDAADIRRLIVAGLAAAANPPRASIPQDLSFASVISDYEPASARSATPIPSAPTVRPATTYADLEGLI